MTDLRLVYGCPKWCTEDHTQQAWEDCEHHAGAVHELRLPDGRLIVDASLTLEPGTAVPQLVVSGTFGSFLDEVTLLGLEEASTFEAAAQRFAAHVVRMTQTVRSAVAQQPKGRKPKKRPLEPSLQHCSRETRLYLAERDGRHCFYCRTPFETLRDATTDHYIPRSLWPCNLPANLVLACQPCNVTKADLLPWPIARALLAWAREGGQTGEAEAPDSGDSVAC
ncbi:5-methylcytosine-specific restriction endonuclease McrA [Streptomyces sp. SAI-144]|uniref:HNH endonuclease n=1 Tax=Streptomyces sp. SAI-144 TaxID=2940544 RepID=UPI002473F258|nr:HNH endonuclease signature motif containing protein [Streptomyces sp. SAI-144]MDH6432613.1 5-methylcytosine-specific restriction endonuclease McrA [Streptomyces sp. SAI-144]